MNGYVVLLEHPEWPTEVVGTWPDLESAGNYARRMRNIGWTARVLDYREVARARA